MKKIIPTILCTALVLCGCGKKTSQISTPETDRLFSCEAVITDDDIEFCGTIKRLGNGIWSAEITSPEELSGIVLSYSSDGISASYQGMSFTLDKENAPKANTLGAIFSAIDESSLMTEMSCSENGECRTYCGSGEFGDYEIKTDMENNLTGFTMQDEGINAEFSEFSVIT